MTWQLSYTCINSLHLNPAFHLLFSLLNIRRTLYYKLHGVEIMFAQLNVFVFPAAQEMEKRLEEKLRISQREK